jgi:hypothetical protein
LKSDGEADAHVVVVVLVLALVLAVHQHNYHPIVRSSFSGWLFDDPQTIINLKPTLVEKKKKKKKKGVFSQTSFIPRMDGITIFNTIEVVI